MITRILLVMMISMSAASAAEQKPIDYQSMYDKCINDAGTINNSIVSVCASSTSTAAKKELNALYKKIYAMLLEKAPEDSVKFESSQKAWLSYRNTHCTLAGSYVGSPMYDFCPMQLTITRVSELREFALE